MRVLVLDGDSEYRNAVCGQLAAAGMDVLGIGSGAQLDTVLAQGAFDVVLSEVGLPDESGFSVAARLRLVSNASLILLTRAEKREDRILALTIGVDHYLVKPEDPRELEMLLGNLRKRSAEPPAALPRAGTWIFDAARWTLVAPEGVSVSLSRAEHQLLGCLLARIGEVVPRGDLLAALNPGEMRAYSRNVDMIISRLRRKVSQVSPEKIPILSSRGIGYVFTRPGKVVGDAAAQAGR